MQRIEFRENPLPTLGVELELVMVDAETDEPAERIAALRDVLPLDLEPWVKPELLQCCVELITDVCPDVAAVERDLRAKVDSVQGLLASLGARLLPVGTHPRADWRRLSLHPDPRYLALLERMQWVVRRFAVFGMHVHVGMPSAEVCIGAYNRIVEKLPLLLALSVNSPFWQGEDTGLRSVRVKIFENLSQGGLPDFFADWTDYETTMHRLIATGTIETIREIWWDARVHPDFGTIEFRICDMPPTLERVLEITALTQCMAIQAIDDHRAGRPWREPHRLVVRENKWRACRYGLDAEMLAYHGNRTTPVREALRAEIERLGSVAEQLGCAEVLAGIDRSIDRPSGADRQLALHDGGSSFAPLVDELVRGFPGEPR